MVPTVFRHLCILVLALAIFPAVLAEGNVSLASQKIDMYIAYNKVLVESELVFASRSTSNISIELPFDARQITDNIDSSLEPTILDENRLVFYLKDGRRIDYSYITSELLDGDSFIASFAAPLDTEMLKVRLSLPEKATLGKPLRKGTVLGSSVYPKPKRLETDGQVITVVWEFADVKKDDEMALYVNYEKPIRYMVPITLVVIGVIVIVSAGAYLFMRSRIKEASKTHHVKVRSVTEPTETHLKEDEEQVVNLLKLKEGKCEQGTLRVATGFSKAKLSGLLKELEERKIVHKEKRGKKNLVFLK